MKWQDAGECCIIRIFIICTALNIIIIIKSRRIRLVGDVTHMEDVRNAYKTLVGKPEGKRPLEDLGIDGSIILKWVLR
jgi:hypothetical protein